MPTPGGLPKAGDQLIHEGVVYVITERTSTSAPFSVWVERYDGLRIQGLMANNHSRLRKQKREYMVSCETGKLPGGWQPFTDVRRPIPPRPGSELRNPVTAAKAETERMLDRDNPRDVAKVEAEADRQGTYMPARIIRVQDAHRYKDPKDAKFYGHECEAILRDAFGTAQALVMSDAEAFDLAIRLLQYLRDKAEGITS